MSVSNLLENWAQVRHEHPNNDKPHDPYKWAMAIDLDACTGCNACSIACYAENNIPVVGKERFQHGQQMHWMRVERYWDEDGREFPDQGFQFLPMMCQQCEAAPCETVCPVAATNHTADGLNSQIYNRCIGSRYCSANCPFKVRYFNWYDYPTDEMVWPAEMQQQMNPDVSVRSKGVMEKCNFCIARIREGKDIAKDQGREVFDGEVKTACQQTCPTEAIIFGNIKDQESQVTKVKSTTKRGYLQLEEMNFKPAITYLKKVTHDNKKA